MAAIQYIKPLYFCLQVGVVVWVSPRDTSGKVVVGFAIQYQYTNTVFAMDSKEVHTATIRVPVFLTLGTM